MSHGVRIASLAVRVRGEVRYTNGANVSAQLGFFGVGACPRSHA
jgi:hypothetical protein